MFIKLHGNLRVDLDKVDAYKPVDVTGEPDESKYRIAFYQGDKVLEITYPSQGERDAELTRVDQLAETLL